MKICLIAQIEPSLNTGGGKAQYHLALEWKSSGHQLTVFGYKSLLEYCQRKQWVRQDASKDEAFEKFLHHEGHHYDIIDFDYAVRLPKDLTALSSTLLVCRTVLYLPSPTATKFPVKRRCLSQLKHIVSTPLKHIKQLREDRTLTSTLLRSDLITVPSTHAEKRALELGVAPKKLCQIPYALSDHNRNQLSQIQPSITDSANIVFLGTFDFRKGCLDLVDIFARIRDQRSDATLTLLGAQGLHSTENSIYRYFRPSDRPHVSIHLKFDPDSLIHHLRNKQLALFPSYLEGCPFSVQETLYAGIPTLGYDSPGTADLLPHEWKSSTGDTVACAQKALELLASPSPLHSKRARQQIDLLTWPKLAVKTLDIYQHCLTQKKNNMPNISTNQT